MNVLVVDDQYDVVQGLLSGIDWTGLGVAEVFAAYSADEAISTLSENDVDLLLCDIEMPPRSGFDVLLFAREQHIPLECIFLTSHANFSYAQSAVKLGSFDYILQPARYEEITQAISRALDKLHSRGLSSGGRHGLQRMAAASTERASVDLKEEDHPVKRAISYIRRNIYHDLTRTEIAEAVYLNPDYLSRLFKRVEGVSLNDFITSEKMQAACSLLSHTQIPVGLIASKLGYTNFSYFSQIFRRNTGMTPLEYRQTHR